MINANVLKEVIDSFIKSEQDSILYFEQLGVDGLAKSHLNKLEALEDIKRVVNKLEEEK